MVRLDCFAFPSMPLYIDMKVLHCPAETVSSSLTISTPSDFDFWRTVYSHGWCALAPFSIDKAHGTISRPFRLTSGAVVSCTMAAVDSRIVVKVQKDRPLSPSQRQELRSQILDCFRLKEDFSEFYSAARMHRRFQWIPQMRVGRLLRAPTVFEDVVKMMCTTNCSWALTEIMVGNLVKKLGVLAGVDGPCFPTPEAMAETTESFLRREIKSGYRSPFLLEFSRNVANKKIDVESWRMSALPTDELYELVLSVKGIGVYAAGNIMKLIGRYDYLGLDSWVRKKFSEIHKNGRRVGDRTIQRFYEPYGRWKGLFFWLEMTREWLKKDVPF